LEANNEALRRISIVLLLAALVAVPALAQAPADIQKAVDAAYAKYKDLQEGKNADYIPALAKVDRSCSDCGHHRRREGVLRGRPEDGGLDPVDLESVHGRAGHPGAGLESIAKQIGVDATGARFNSIIAIEGVKMVAGAGAPEMNPLVNPGPSRRRAW